MQSHGSKSMTSINGKVVGAPSPSRKKLDVNVLAAAIKAGNTADVQATLANANLAVDDDILFWDYSVDPEAGLCAATCLHYAAFHDCLPSVQWLLDVGANPAVRDALGRQPVHVCKDTAVKAELLRGETAYTAKQRMNKRESLAGSGGQAQPRAGTGDESSESLTATETKEDGMNSFELPEESSDVARKAAEILKEVERVKADRNSERLARAKAAEAQDALQKQFLPMIQALEAKLKSQLVTVAECQQAVLDAEKQEVVTETALLAAEAKVSQLESEGKRAESSWGPPDAVTNAIVLKANDDLGALDCRAAIIEAQSMNDPPATIKHLLIAIHAVIQDTVGITSPMATASAQSAWTNCRQFLRSDEFLDAMFQATPEQLAGRSDTLSSVVKQMGDHGLSPSSVERACPVFVPMFDWLRILVTAAQDIQKTAPALVASTTTRLDLEAAREQAKCLQQQVAIDRSVVTADTSKLVLALKEARATLAELVKVRLQCGMSPAGVWDGSEDVNAVAREPHAAVTRLKGYDSRELVSSRRGSFDETDSKLQCTPSPRRRSLNDASPPTVPRPVSRDASPLVRHRRASLESATASRRDRWNTDSKEAPGSESGAEGDGERWPADSSLTESIRRRNSSHSNSPLRRQSLTGTSLDAPSLAVTTSTLVPSASTAPFSLPLAPTLSSDASPRVSTLSARRQSVTAGVGASLDSPQIRRVRLSSVEATIDPDVLAMLRSQRSNSDSSSDPNEAASVTTDPSSPGSSFPAAAMDIDGLPVIPAVLSARRSSIVKTASPLRRKSIGPTMMDATNATISDVGGTSGPVSPQKEAPLMRVRRMSLTERVDAPTEMPAVVAVSTGRAGSSSTSPVPTGSPLVSRSSPSPQPASATVTSSVPSTTTSVSVAMTNALSLSAQKRAGPVVAQHAGITSVETGGVSMEGFTPTAAALRRASLVQRPSPLRRQSVTAGDPSTASAVASHPEGRMVSLPPQSSPEHSLSPEPVKQFLSPGNSAFRRCLSQSPHEAMLGKSPPPQGQLSPEAPPRSVSEPVSASSSETATSSREDTAASVPLSGLAAFKGVHQDVGAGSGSPSRRVSRSNADHLSLNMDAVQTPTKDAVDIGSRPSSARLSLSGSKASSVRRLVEALSYGEEVGFSSTL